MATSDNESVASGTSLCSAVTPTPAISPTKGISGPRCSVCGDEASGFHYGVDSCEGCKGFFRRCIIQGLTQQCANAEKCDITPLTRNSCQYCRLKKCFSVGMSRGASRLGRRPKRLKNNGADGKPATPAKPLISIAPHPQSQLGVLPLSMAELEALLDKLNSQNRYNIKLPSLLAALGRLIQDGERSATDTPSSYCAGASSSSMSPSILSNASYGNGLCRSDSSSLSASPVTRRPSPDTTGTESDVVSSPSIGPANPFNFSVKTEPGVETSCGGAGYEFFPDKTPMFTSRITSSYDARALVGTVYHQLREAEQRRRLLGGMQTPASATISMNAETSAPASDSLLSRSGEQQRMREELPPLPAVGVALAELAEEARRLPMPGSERAHLVDQVIRSVVAVHCSTCHYTTDKVAMGLQRYHEAQQLLAAEGRMQASPDPMEIWNQFVKNMTPVIERVVRFSKQIPGFAELPPDDQMKLIKQGSFEVILARYVLLFTEDGMFVPDMTMKVPLQLMAKMPMGSFFEEQWRFASTLNRLRLTDGEVGLLTAIMILNPERTGLLNHKAVHKLRGLMLQCLYVHMKHNHPDNYDRLFTDTVAVLPLSYHINQMHSHSLNNLKISSPDIKFPELHLEVYDDQS